MKNNNKSKLISIVLPTFNGASRNNGVYLKNAIESVLNQSYTNLELIIVNDGSTDNTEKICKKYNDSKIKYIYQKNKGLSGARNTGIENSTGKYITFLDDDDIFYQDKIREQYDYLEKNSADVVYCLADRIDINGNKTSTIQYKKSRNILEVLLYQNVINSPASVMLSKSVVEKIGFFKEYLKSCEDWDYWIRVASQYPFYCLEKPLVGYRIHSSSQMSRNREKMEFYDYIVLMENLMELNIADKDKYLYNLYKKFTKIDYGIRDFERFHRNYKITSIYGKHSFEWVLKYWLSKMTFIFNFTYNTYYRLKK